MHEPVKRSVSGMMGLFLLLAATPALAGRVGEQVHAPPTLAELTQELNRWFEQRQLTRTPLPEAVAPLWQFAEPPSASQLFDALMRTYYLADPNVRKLVDACGNWSFSPNLLRVELPAIEQASTEPLLVHNCRYFLARHLTLLGAFPEAEEVFRDVEIRYLVDPAGGLFHRAVCEHRLLMKREGLASLAQLLDQTEKVPLRYRQLGDLMRQDLQAVKEKSLGEVARQMKDVHQRLSLQQADEGVQEVEDRIVATLDELIKKMEDQQKQQNSGGVGGGMSPGTPPTNPANDSYLGGVRGQGLTEKKDIGHKDHWGDLPPKEREAAKNMLDQQFPAHYRQAVEEYLKKLAERPAP